MRKARRIGTLIFFFSTLICLFVVIAEAANSDFPYIPNPNWTSGDICDTQDPDFKEFRYSEKIPYCERNVSQHTKTQIYALYGVPTHCRPFYTIDHFIPLSIGGTNDVRNLWPEARAVKKARQNLEQTIFKKLERGQITQTQAIDLILQAKWHPPVDQIDLSQICLH